MIIRFSNIIMNKFGWTKLYIFICWHVCHICFQDYFTNQSNKERDTAGKVDYMMRMVQLEVQGLSLPGMSFRKLRAVAAMRFVIAEAAKAMHAVFIDCTADLSVYEEFFELIEEMCIRHDQTAVTNAQFVVFKLWEIQPVL